MNWKLSLAFAALACAMTGQNSASQRADWNKPFPPFRIIGNIYYVGVAGVSSFLIKSDRGDILIDGALPESAPLIEKNVAAVGAQMKDIRILLNSHAHFDHAGGLAALKRVTGAQFVASAGDKPALETGHALNGTSAFPPVKVDRVVADGDTVQLGNVTLTAHLTPGHTKGCTSWGMTTTEGGKPYRVLFFCSTSVAGNHLVHNRTYPEIVSEYKGSFRKLRDMPCDVLLAPHAGIFQLEQKKAQLDQGKRDAFVDPAALRRLVDESERDFQKQLAEQKKAAGKRA